ncbi:TraB family protein [Candidatus Woesearchaeota archaeon]|nr:TraB family protein [Candidatus Woesearchaeota archaeon]
MQRYKNLTIIGTSHISIESIAEVKKVLAEQRPEIIALELDKKRFFGLMQKNKPKIRLGDIKYLGLSAWLLNLFGAWAEKKMGKVVGVEPGEEMRVAINSAAQFNAKIALIDQDITITLKRLLKGITWKERLRFVYDLLRGLLWGKPEIKFDLRKVPNEKVIEKLIGSLKKNYPSIYRVLIDERNVFMAKKLSEIIKSNPNKLIVGVVGAGHEKGLIKEIKKFVAQKV